MSLTLYKPAVLTVNGPGLAVPAFVKGMAVTGPGESWDSVQAMVLSPVVVVKTVPVKGGHKSAVSGGSPLMETAGGPSMNTLAQAVESPQPLCTRKVMI
jgi:hypothetical protein